MQEALWALIAVLVVSVGGQATAYWVGSARRQHPWILLGLIGLAAGAMSGEALLHAIPEATEAWEGRDARGLGLVLVAGFGAMMLATALLRHRKCCDPARGGSQPYTWTTTLGDSVCNFSDGIAIAASFLVGVPLGIAATLAILLHELPQEAGQCATLMRGGMTRKQALRWNALSAIPAFLGAALVLLLPLAGESVERFLLPAVAGAFLHIAAADLLPELRRGGAILAQRKWSPGAGFSAGLALMATLTLLE